MREPRPIGPMGVDKLIELSDVNMTSYYEDKRIEGENMDVYVLVNDFNYKKELQFKLVPLKSLLNMVELNGMSKKTDLEKNKDISIISSKISGYKSWTTRELNRLDAKIDLLINKE